MSARMGAESSPNASVTSKLPATGKVPPYQKRPGTSAMASGVERLVSLRYSPPATMLTGLAKPQSRNCGISAVTKPLNTSSVTAPFTWVSCVIQLMEARLLKLGSNGLNGTHPEFGPGVNVRPNMLAGNSDEVSEK